jgi:two-component system, cell cycle sensor histidine kinase and response regulator CckA
MPLFGFQPAGLLDKIFEEVGVALVVIGHDEKLVFANKTASAMFQPTVSEQPISFQEWRRSYSFENSMGQNISVQDSAVMRALKGEHVESEEVRARFPDGSDKWLLIWAYPFSVMGLSGVLALIIDETVDLELRRAASELQRMETLAVLAAGLSHDLNNMLENITINVELVLRTKAQSQESGARLDQISMAARKASKLVKRLMQFSRTQELNCFPIQINDVLTDVLRLVKPMFRDNIHVKTELPEGLPNVVADPAQLEQAIVNLIVNAVDAMPDGGELKISTALESTTNPGKVAAEEFVCTTIADTGIGIPEAIQSQIFDPFFTTKPQGKGTGLGLSSVYGIVRQHQGRIRVKSAPGAGAIFIISLPVQKKGSMSEVSVGYEHRDARGSY